VKKADTIQDLRLNRRLSMFALAKEAGVSYNTVRRYDEQPFDHVPLTLLRPMLKALGYEFQLRIALI
jgi:transcriptional regulator with XRE-family HTH domain